MGDQPVPATSGAGPIDTKNQQPALPTGGAGITQAQPLSSGQQPLEVEESTSTIQNDSAFSSQLDMASPNASGQAGPYNMASMSSALPQGANRPGGFTGSGQSRFNSANSPNMMHQMPQYGGQHPAMAAGGQGYYMSQQQHMQQYYGGQLPAQGHSPLPARHGMPFYPNQMMMNNAQPAFYYPQAGPFPGQNQPMHGGMVRGNYATQSPTSPTDHRRMSHSIPAGMHGPKSRHTDDPDARQNAVRGPPRKPRQSGHAIWIGNLPPQTDLMSLVHHVCKEAGGLESLFLISKSNCAFANFKSEATCAAAQQKLHDSRFQSVRLVSRLRKGTVEGPASESSPSPQPATSTDSPSLSTPTDQSQGIDPIDADTTSPTTTQSASFKSNATADATSQKDRFFVLKSLTVEDLELSVRNNVWATQSHNETTLSKAFRDADNVYLVFSANKSGEYFGYARMTSEINEDPEAAIEFAPKDTTATDLNLPKAIPTEATQYAPKGRIIDDLARGTIFWEADLDEIEDDSDNESDAPSAKSETTESDKKTWGKPFQLEWLSTTRLPFYRTRGLRNPWNSNREVKIARDGTELEPTVGRRLIGLFNRIQSPVASLQSIRTPMGVMPAYPQMRPYGP